MLLKKQQIRDTKPWHLNQHSCDPGFHTVLKDHFFFFIPQPPPKLFQYSHILHRIVATFLLPIRFVLIVVNYILNHWYLYFIINILHCGFINIVSINAFMFHSHTVQDAYKDTISTLWFWHFLGLDVTDNFLIQWNVMKKSLE